MATTYDNASLVMIPSGVKEDKLYSIKPTDGSGDFTFSRGTDTATRVNASGLIEKERSNQILQSNTFSTTWTTSPLTITGGQTDPNGGSTATLFTATGNSGQYFYQSSSTIGTYSIYAKAGTRDSFSIINGVYNNGASFNLSTQTATSYGQGILASIEDVGGDWYRCSVYIRSGSQFLIGLMDIAGGGMGSGQTMTFFGAQVNYGIVATDYIETTTAAVYEGITDNLPRLDYSGGASCPSLLLEPSRTNLITNSEYFDSWTLIGGGSVTSNTTTSPEGVENAATIEPLGYARQHFTMSSGSNTFSIYLKAKDADCDVRIGFLAAGDAGLATFTETITTSEWKRISTTYTNATAPIGVFFNIQSGDNDVYAYGAQVEAGSYPTSYIPTYGTSASRAKDAAYDLSAADLIGNDEGVIFIDVQMPSVIELNTTFSIGGGTSGEYAQLEIRNDLSINWRYRQGGTDYINANVGSYSAGDRLKIAFAYKNGDSILYKNGSSIATDTGTIGANTWDEVRFSNFVGTGNLNASVNQSLVFKTRLTNAELAALTTI